MAETRVSFSYLVKRGVVSVFTLWMMVTLMFLLLKAMPGDVTQLLLNPQLTSEQLQALREQYGLNDPLWVQYLKWVTNYLQLELGRSLNSPELVSSIILDRLPRTLVLFGTTFLISYTIGVILGINFGWRKGTLSEQGGFISGITLSSVPFFWIGWLLIALFAGYLGVLPFGAMTQSGVADYTSLSLVVDVLYHMIMPAASLVIVGWGGTMLVMRTQMQEVTSAPYVETARAKGLSPTVIKYKHAARNALIPVATQAIVGIAFVIDGAVIVEEVFSWPGIGKLLVTAISSRNFPVAFAAFFFLGALIVLMRLLTDIAYTFLDPRIKFGESS